jgi:hypothetical protein
MRTAHLGQLPTGQDGLPLGQAECCFLLKSALFCSEAGRNCIACSTHQLSNCWLTCQDVRMAKPSHYAGLLQSFHS